MLVESRELKATGKISLITKRNVENEGGEEVPLSRKSDCKIPDLFFFTKG